MRVDDFAFELPRELIAERPCEPRDAARLLHIPAAGELADRHIADLPALLSPGDLLVCNDTKVIPARLVGRRGAATVEVTLYRDLGGGAWRVFAKGARRLRVGDRLVFAADFAGSVTAKHPEGDLTLSFDLEAVAFRAAATRATRRTTRRSSPAPRGRSRRRLPVCTSPRSCSTRWIAAASSARC